MIRRFVLSAARIKPLLLLVGTVWLSLIIASSIPAQTRVGATGSPGSISGVIYFEDGRIVFPGAQISVMNRASGEAFTAKSDDMGKFAFFQLPAGLYSLTAVQVGFQTTLIRDLPVRSAQNIPLSLVIKVDSYHNNPITEFAEVRTDLLSTPSTGPSRQTADLSQTFYSTIVLNSVDRTTTTGVSQVLCSGRLGLLGVFDDTTNTIPAIPLSHPLPDYPQMARDQEIEGTVGLTGTIGVDGRMASVQVTSSSNAIFESSALDAVRQWTYKPMQQNNGPIESPATVTVRFAFIR